MCCRSPLPPARKPRAIEHEAPHFILARARIEAAGVNGVHPRRGRGKGFGKVLFEIIARRRSLRGGRGNLNGFCEPRALRAVRNGGVPEPSASKTEQRNTVIIYGDNIS